MTSPRTYRALNFAQNNLALLLISTSIIIVERIIKFYITDNLRMNETIPIFGRILGLTRVENEGAGFGILQGQTWIFIMAAIAVFAMIIYFYNQIIYDKSLVFASGFILAGTVGNMMDRIFFGRVIDYINVPLWPTFNLSDASLVIGTVLVVIRLYFWEKKPDKETSYVHY